MQLCVRMRREITQLIQQRQGGARGSGSRECPGRRVWVFLAGLAFALQVSDERQRQVMTWNRLEQKHAQAQGGLLLLTHNSGSAFTHKHN